jgi:hypothetical protein
MAGWRNGRGWCGAVRTLLVALMLCMVGTPAGAEDSLPVVARVGPWPAVSGLVGYGGRLWLVNSVKGVNHNSADIYSYDLAEGRLRYERHLFSQDAGRPLVSGGLLYWPYEDSRFSLGWGVFQVTDGRRWRSGVIPSARSFHTHALAELGGRLVAATSAWRAGLQVSADGGRSWRRVYDHPTPERRVSRITELHTLGRVVVGSLRGPEGRRLLRFDGESVAELPGWPHGSALRGLAVRGGWLYGLVEEAEGTAVWRSDGRRSELVSPAREGWRPRGLAAGPDGLWAVSAEGPGGRLWHSPDGTRWRVRYRLEGGVPGEVALHGGLPYVAGTGHDGRGLLWGPAPPAPVEAAAIGPAALDGITARTPGPRDWTAAGVELDRALADPASYEGHGDVLRDLVYRAALAGPPAGFLAGRLSRAFPDLRLSLIGGNVQTSARQMARWILLWGMALAGEARVPPALIAEPWSAPANRAEKYFETAPAAIWAAGETGQDDRATLAALIERLDRPGDPAWLKGDLVGALTALTGRRFGTDVAAWRAWWARAEAVWPE